jgi:hypothetical protein
MKCNCVNQQQDKEDEFRCTCDEMGEFDKDWHTCPYSEEINNDYETLCSCCSYCQSQCAWDI